MYTEIKIKMPEEIYLVLKKNAVELAKDLLLKAAVQYYVQDQLSLARAANMCGLTRLEFIGVITLYISRYLIIRRKISTRYMKRARKYLRK